ncbi:transglutaminase domain-containing protein [Halosquirtibacter xylanolyticus]|uniref:transglutaminase domain-containing protein n=1 Tax=Halosquirtibacter xylanolyticus TaxID=3374599 RepID=UPI0037492D65|nr:transglutaminase domain-containing protein [Prolixibacteraceae bacterium]
MKYRLLYLLGFVVLWSCSNVPESSFITDKAYRAKVEKQFKSRMPILEKRHDELLSVFDSDTITVDEKEALKFIYAYMPLNDMADYNGDFLYKNVHLAFMIRDFFPWGKNVSEENFRHYVVPFRNNNENLDNHREVFFHELKDRVKGMNMHDAALEVNHWCHEKVTYHVTDARTLSPMATVKNAYGRCGEESVFAVEAYRSVGIPARQVYTPRWAHSDDNHAWVEVCIDGKWYFTGACEPAPEFNMGWFEGPASRGILMNARTYGLMQGAPAYVSKDGLTSLLNVTENYAPVADNTIKVVDINGNPIANASVAISLYNYAEIYPIMKRTTDKDGVCHIKTGLGDVLVWVYGDKGYSMKKITASGGVHEIVYEPRLHTDGNIDFDLVPPIENVRRVTEVTEAQRKENSRRLAQEDKIRGAYEKTFVSNAIDIPAKAKELGVDAEALKVSLKAARGNGQVVLGLLEEVTPSERDVLMQMYHVVSYKDLQDTPKEIFESHLKDTPAYSKSKYDTKEFWAKYILDPRVEKELLSSYKAYLQRVLGDITSAKALIQWMHKNMKLDTVNNVFRVPLSPQGAFELKRVDKRSRSIFFVATSRSLGIPARLEPATKQPQYFEGGQWVDVRFEPKAKLPKKGTLQLVSADPTKPLQYYGQFTIARFDNGLYRTLAFDQGKAVKDFPEGVKLEKKAITVDVPVGAYMVTSGNRLKDGSVLTRLAFFEVKEGKKTKVKVSIRKDMKPLPVLGKVNYTTSFNGYPDQSKSISMAKTMKGKVSVIAWLDPDREPTKHFMGDVKSLKKKFESKGVAMTFLVPKDKLTSSFERDPFVIPSQAQYGVDQTTLAQFEAALKTKSNGRLPAVFVVNTKGEIVYQSHGYQIGVGEQVIKTIQKLEETK